MMNDTLSLFDFLERYGESIAIERDVLLSDASTFGIGGRARIVVSPKSEDMFLQLLRDLHARHVPYRVMGGGSNIVFPDEGISDLLIRVGYEGIERDGVRVVVQAGTRLSDVIQTTIGWGLSGLETLSGIPGTIGGAVYGNAGAYGHAVGEVVDWVLVYDGVDIRRLDRDMCGFEYRDSVFKRNSWTILSVGLRLRESNSHELVRISHDIIAKRAKKYAPGLKCPGSFFKNIPSTQLASSQIERIGAGNIQWGKLPAGYLLESVGAKGMRVGDIAVSSFHANVIINLGTGTARDVGLLATELKSRVYTQYGISLEEEVRFF